MSEIVLGIKIKSDGSSQVVGDFGRIKEAINQTGTSSKRASSDVSALSNTLSSAKNAALALFSINLAAGFVKQIGQAAEQFGLLSARIQLVTQSSVLAASTQQDLLNIAVAQQTSLDDLGRLYTRIADAGKAAGLSQQELLQVTQNVASTFKISGASAAEVASTVTQLSQALASGTVQWEDFGQLADTNMRLVKLVLQDLNLNMGQLKQAMADGEITSEQLFKSILNGTQQLKTEMAGIPQTVSGAFGAMADVISGFIGKMDQAYNVTSTLAGIINEITKGIQFTFDPTPAQEIFKIDQSVKSRGYITQDEDRRKEALRAQLKAVEEQKRIAEFDAGIAKIWSDAQNKKAAADEEAAKSAKEHASAMDHAAKTKASAASTAASAYQSERKEVAQTLIVIQQETQLIGLTDTARARAIELQQALNKAKGEEVAQIKAAMAVKWAVADAESVVQASQDAQIQALNEQIDRYQQLTLSARELYIEKRRQEGLTPDQIAPVLARFDQNEGLAQQADKTNQAKQALDNYINSLDTARDSAQNFGDVTSSIFDSQLGGINTLAGAFDSLTKRIGETNDQLRQNAEAQAENARLNTGEEYQKNAIKLQKQRQNLEKQQVKDSLAGIRQVATATANMYGENTKARKAFNAVALAASVAERAADLAGLGAKAASAVLTQGQGDPYTAFARIAAMAAIVGSVISAAGGGTFQFGGSDKVPTLAKAPDSGTVLGDKEANSESISNVYDLLGDIHAREYRELQGINDGISSLKNGITNTIAAFFKSGNVNAPDGLKLGTVSNVPTNAIGAAYSKVDPIAGFLVKGLFGTTKRDVTGNGILIQENTLKDLIKGLDVSAKQWTEITTTTKSWFSKKTSIEEVLTELDPGLTDSISQVFKGMGQALLGFSKDFGIDFTKAIQNYQIPELRIDLTKLTGDEAVKKLNDVLSTQLDTMTGAIFGSVVARYQQLGEGLFETLSRIKVQKAVFNDAFQSSGQQTSGNQLRTSDQLSTLFGGVKNFKSQFADFFNAFFTGAERASDSKRRLDEVFADNGKLPETRQAYRDLVRAQDLTTRSGRKLYFQLLDLSDAADTYYSAQEEFRKSAESTLRGMAGLAPTLQSEIYNFNVSLIEARANWHAAGLDMTEMTRLTGKAFDELKTKLLAPFTNARDDIANTIASTNGTALPVGDIAAMMEELKGLTDPTEQIAMVNKIQKALKTRYDNEVKLIQKTTQALNGIKDFLDSLNLSDLSTLSPEQRLQQAKGDFGTTLLKAQAKDADALAALPEVSRKYLEEAKNYYASGADYAAIFNSVTDVLSTLVGSAVGTGSAADEAQKAIDSANAALTSSLQSLDDILAGFVKTLAEQFDTIKNNTTQPDPSVKPEKPVTTRDTLAAERNRTQAVVDDAKANGFKNKELKKEISAANVASMQLRNYDYWHNIGDEERALKSIDDTKAYFEALANSTDQTLTKKDRKWYASMLDGLQFERGGTVKFRASGGMTSGPTVINEAGPELIDFAHPTMIVNNQNTQRIIAMGNDQAVAELQKQTRELQALVRLQQASISAMIERMDKANANTETLAKKARLEAAA